MDMINFLIGFGVITGIFGIIVLIGWITSRIARTNDDSLQEYFARGILIMLFLSISIGVGILMYFMGDNIKHLWINQ